MKTKINVNSNNCCKIVLEDGAVDIAKSQNVTIDANGKISIDGIGLENYQKQKQETK